VNFDPIAVRLAVDYAGADHVLAASDYPHQIGSVEKMKSSLGALNVTEAERAKIMGENAKRLYKL
jgi:aminocarboxymuconate-semialdehyde decarboxylase